ncbi:MULTISPECIES: DUF4870 domain-containing protein [Alkalimonas]|uniref:DUF4870 domain-containing protein n=1 Tax=Alkalimonas mucilaginosa TaxID=3057676 RepID=A0ABU7JD37_9GAMM|nr:DUF4870 domain-containing protein [Alkalimonas sp. MEB004]MEE2023390.1 DUF4870 domain-containing protein [Alkalimonas sp. MEB004]
MDLDKLEKLNELKAQGVITEEEFQQQKEKILNQPAAAASAGLDFNDVRSYSMLMHLAQLCAFILPLLGWVVPLVMWLTRKEDQYIDQQGKVVFNWIISAVIYGFVSLLLMVVLIGIPLMIALVVCNIVFAIMGALRAKDGIVKNYPLAIRFFRVEEGQS